MIAGGVFAVWLIVLVILGVASSEKYGRRVAERMAESLKGLGTVGDSDLALVRGWLELERLRVRRADVIGKLALDVAEIRCELSPLGLALVDGSCRELVVSGVRLEISTFALFKLQRPTRPPIRAGRVVIEDAVLVIAPLAEVPRAPGMQLVIEHAEAGPTTFKTPLSWLFALESFRASLELPVGTIKLAYRDGVFTVSGGIFGSTPVSLRVELPVADPSDDPKAEMRKLVKFGRKLAERLAFASVETWLESKLP